MSFGDMTRDYSQAQHVTAQLRSRGTTNVMERPGGYARLVKSLKSFSLLTTSQDSQSFSAQHRPDENVSLATASSDPAAVSQAPCLYHIPWHETVCPIGLNLLPDHTLYRETHGYGYLRNHCLSPSAGALLPCQLRTWRQW